MFCNRCSGHCDTNFSGEPKLTNYPATRFLINHYNDAVEDLRDAFRLFAYTALKKATL